MSMINFALTVFFLGTERGVVAMFGISVLLYCVVDGV